MSSSTLFISFTLATFILLATAATVTHITPNSGPVAGGFNVTITGTGFGASVKVMIGSSTCALVSSNATSIICTAGYSNSSSLVVITVSTGATPTALTDSTCAASNCIFFYVPVVTSVQPTWLHLSGGTVTIMGSGFDSSSFFNVLAGSYEMTCGNITMNEIICTSPIAPTGIYSVTVGVQVLPNIVLYSRCTTQGCILEYGNSAINSIFPNSGLAQGGDTITIEGLGFPNTAVVTIGGSACTVTYSDNATIICTTASNVAGAYSVSVNFGGVDTICVGTCTFQYTPQILSISPNMSIAAGGTTITVTGYGFSANQPIIAAFNGVRCIVGYTNITFNMFTCTSSPIVAGGANGTISIANIAGVCSGACNTTFYPSINDIEPHTIYLAGGAVTISGSGFAPSVTTVTIGANPCVITGTPTLNILVCTASSVSSAQSPVVSLSVNGVPATCGGSCGLAYTKASVVDTIFQAGQGAGLNSGEVAGIVIGVVLTVGLLLAATAFVVAHKVKESRAFSKI